MINPLNLLKPKAVAAPAITPKSEAREKQWNDLLNAVHMMMDPVVLFYSHIDAIYEKLEVTDADAAAARTIASNMVERLKGVQIGYNNVIRSQQSAGNIPQPGHEHDSHYLRDIPHSMKQVLATMQAHMEQVVADPGQMEALRDYHQQAQAGLEQTIEALSDIRDAGMGPR